MANVVVVGAQWGDEGKGKIVDWLSEQADVVVRFQGGHNAGHTLVIGNQTYKLSLLPSGVVRAGKLAVIGNGVVLDPHALVDEIGKLKGQGVEITRDNLRVADNAALILSLHRELDALRESGGAGTRIGTTRRGIGPAYEDKVGRRAIRLMDLADLDALPDKIERLLAHRRQRRAGQPELFTHTVVEPFDGQYTEHRLPRLVPQLAVDGRAGCAPAVRPVRSGGRRGVDERWVFRVNGQSPHVMQAHPLVHRLPTVPEVRAPGEPATPGLVKQFRDFGMRRQ